MRPFALFLAASTALCAPVAASAQSIDQAGAEALEAQVPAALDRFLQSAPEVSYRWAGEVQAVPSGDSYSLALPRLELDVDGNVDIIVPAFTADVEPQTNGWQRIAWDSPSPVVIVNPDDPRRGFVFNFESLDNAVTLAPEYGMALDADIGFERINATLQGPDGEAGAMNVDLLELAIQSQPSGTRADTFDSQTMIALSQLSAALPTEDFAFGFEQLTIGGNTERQRLDLFAGLQDALDGLDPESEAFLEAFLAAVRAHADEKWIGEADYAMDVRGLSLDAREGTGRVGLVSLGLQGVDLDQASSDIGVAFELEDISSPMIPPAMTQIAPTQVVVNVLAEDAPLEAVAQMLYDAMGEPLSAEALIGPKGRRARTSSMVSALEALDPMDLLGVLLSSDAQVVLDNLFVEAPIGYISAQGTVDPDPDAAFSAIGSASIDVAGMPEMIAVARQLEGEAVVAGGFASVLMAMGRDDTDEDGVAIKTFDIEVTAAGQITLNGNDMSAMLMMFQ